MERHVVVGPLTDRDAAESRRAGRDQDPEALTELIGRVRTQSDALADLIEGLAREAGAALSRLASDPEEIPRAPEPRARPGDLFIVGEHRLLAGTPEAART